MLESTRSLEAGSSFPAEKNESASDTRRLVFLLARARRPRHMSPVSTARSARFFLLLHFLARVLQYNYRFSAKVTKGRGGHSFQS
ncbi:MAG: hypothetical protein FWF77_02410 [Defluviitaleaceae bacterium]|nr:hypothetical protein [Defluviitaleaceae bacterium]